MLELDTDFTIPFFIVVCYKVFSMVAYVFVRNYTNLNVKNIPCTRSARDLSVSRISRTEERRRSLPEPSSWVREYTEAMVAAHLSRRSPLFTCLFSTRNCSAREVVSRPRAGLRIGPDTYDWFAWHNNTCQSFGRILLGGEGCC